jgi:hypothetical protein
MSRMRIVRSGLVEADQVVVVGLKAILETGKGAPFPDDVRISVDAD